MKKSILATEHERIFRVVKEHVNSSSPCKPSGPEDLIRALEWASSYKGYNAASDFYTQYEFYSWFSSLSEPLITQYYTLAKAIMLGDAPSMEWLISATNQVQKLPHFATLHSSATVPYFKSAPTVHSVLAVKFIAHKEQVIVPLRDVVSKLPSDLLECALYALDERITMILERWCCDAQALLQNVLQLQGYKNG